MVDLFLDLEIIKDLNGVRRFLIGKLKIKFLVVYQIDEVLNHWVVLILK